MTNEDKLRIFAAYLPYGLNVALSDEGKYNLDNEYPNEHANKKGIITEFSISNGEFGYGEFKVSKNHYFSFNELSEIKPVLYPLGYLTKEIEHEGERFVPIVELAKKFNSLSEPTVIKYDDIIDHSEYGIQVSCFIDENRYSYFSIKGGDLILHNEYRIINELLKMHVNVFQLPESEYINKANLKK